MTTTPPTPWKLLRLWELLGIFLVTNLCAAVVVITMREGLGWAVPPATIGGVGGVAGVLLVFAVARRRQASSRRDDEL